MRHFIKILGFILLPVYLLAQQKVEINDLVVKKESLIELISKVNLASKLEKTNEKPMSECRRDSTRIQDSTLGTMELFHYLYNVQGLLSVTNHTYYGVNDTNVFKYTRTYTASNLVSEFLIQQAGPNTWFNLSRTTYTYNASNKLTRELEEDWDNFFNGWVVKRDRAMTYDNNQNLISETVSQLNMNNVLTPFILVTYTYSTSAKVLRLETKNWTNNSWRNNSEYLYNYTSSVSLLPDVETFNLWDTINLNWKPFHKNNFVYLGTAIASNTFQVWQANSSSYVNASKRDITYDANGKPNLQILYFWNNAWNPTNKTTTVPLGQGVYLKTQQTYNGTSWVNVVRDKEQYTATNQLLRLTTEVWDGTKWVMSYDQKEFYDCSLLGLSENGLKSRVSIWPNPMKNHLTIQAHQTIVSIHLMDLQGRLLIIGEPSHNQLDVSSMAPGLYVLQLAYKDGSKESIRLLKSLD